MVWSAVVSGIDSESLWASMVFPKGSPRRGFRVVRGGSAGNRKGPTLLRWVLLFVALLVAVVYTSAAWHVISHPQQPERVLEKQQKEQTQARDVKCSFRKYPEHRFYKLETPSQPDFLTGTTEYIYGEWPALLPTIVPSTQKICVDQSPWRRQQRSNNDTLPFADGTNPSLLSVQRYQQQVQQAPIPLSNDISWIATVCMTNSQCSWKDSPEQMKSFHLTSQTNPDTIRTLILLLNDQLETVQETTIFLNLDAPYGKGRKQLKRTLQPHMPALDDARLFVHDGKLWISYREGKLFGYDAQVLNPVHLEFTTTKNDRVPLFKATLLASETTIFCCGRNMALMQNLQQPQSLLSLTWVDPITVIPVDTTPLLQRQQKGRRLKEVEQLSLHDDLNEPDDDISMLSSSNVVDGSSYYFYSSWHTPRRLAEKTKKSHIHGTNAFMLYLEHRQEFLGVAHFHRPNDRNANEYARFGHHYTHAFYTVSPGDPFVLKALSAEFVLPAAAPTSEDAEIIQFISGLEWDEKHHQILLAYGINDCEAAIVRVEAHVVDEWLRPIQAGKQVVDFMQPLKNPPQ